MEAAISAELGGGKNAAEGTPNGEDAEEEEQQCEPDPEVEPAAMGKSD